MFLRISDEEIINVEDISFIEKANTGYTADTAGWEIRIFLKFRDDYAELEFESKEERDLIFNKFNKFLKSTDLREWE